MVLNDRSNVEVVFIVEGTANLSLYAESIKTSYIIPTLEILSGGPPDDNDYEFENTLNCSLFALVVFMTADSAPDSASFCYGPTSSTFKLLQWFDRIQFNCGGASACSHITEGIATSLQCFDEFKIMRENASPGSSLNKITRHCVLICNSPPYTLPASESVSYYGYMIDQLVGIMGERGISLSVFSPRKIPFLFKLYEKAGGDLASALSKNYAKDRRHLVLLKNFQLQERPISPQTNQTSNKSLEKASPSPSPSNQGQKRPLSPASSAVYNKDSVQITIHQQQQPQQTQQQSQLQQQQAQQQQVQLQQQQHTRGPPPPPPAFADKAPTPDNMIRPGPNAMPVLTSQLSSIRQGAPTVVSQHQPGQPNQARMGFSVNQMRPVQRDNYNSVSMQGQLRGAPSPFSAPPPASPMNRASVPSPLSQNVPSPMSVLPNQGGMMGQEPGVTSTQQMIPPGQQITMQPMVMKNSRKIWTGTIEWVEKQGIEQKYPLPCSIWLPNPNNQIDLNVDTWNSVLNLNLVPRHLLTPSFNELKNESHIVTINFANPESEGLQKLSKHIRIVNPPQVSNCGFISLDIRQRVMIIAYAPDKKIFMGFLPINHEAFLTKVRNAVNESKKGQKNLPAGQISQQTNQQPPQSNIGQPMMSQPMGQQQQTQMVQQAMQPPPQPGQMIQQISMSQPQLTANPTGFYQLQQIPGNQVGQQPVPGQMTPMQAQPQQPQLQQQHSIPPQAQQLGQQAGFRNQSVHGIRMNSGPQNQGMMNQGLPPNQMMPTGGPGPQQQANVLLNQALGPIQGSSSHPQFAQQGQIIGGQQQTTATLVTQGGPPQHQQQHHQQPQQQIHFNSQNVSGTTLANLMQHQQQATQQRQTNSQPPPPQQSQQQPPAPPNVARRENLMHIQQLQQKLEAAQRTELQFQQQHHIEQPIPSGHLFFDQSTGMQYSKPSSGELGINFRPISASPRTGPEPETDLNQSKGHLLRPDELAFSQGGGNLQGKPPDNAQAHPQHQQQPLVRQQLQQHIHQQQQQQARLQQLQQPIGVKSAPGLRNLLQPQQHQQVPQQQQQQQQQIRTNMQPGPNQQQWRYSRT